MNLFPNNKDRIPNIYQISRTQTSGFGTIGAAFLYLDALNRHAILSIDFLRTPNQFQLQIKMGVSQYRTETVSHTICRLKNSIICKEREKKEDK